MKFISLKLGALVVKRSLHYFHGGFNFTINPVFRHLNLKKYIARKSVLKKSARKCLVQ